MKKRCALLVVLGVSTALGAEPMPLIEGADPMEIFKLGLGTGLGFEMVGMVIRFVRNLRASGTVDVGG